MKIGKPLSPSPASILKADQAPVRELLDQIDSLGLEDRPKRNRLIHRIKEELTVHMEVEESLFYPAVQKGNGDLASGVLLVALEVQKEVTALLKELSDPGFEGGSFNMKVSGLTQNVLRYLEMEESLVLPHLRALSLDALHAMSKDMEELRSRLRMKQRQTQQPSQQRTPYYPTLQDMYGAPEDDRDSPETLELPGSWQ